MGCELMDGNEYPIACYADASTQGKARHCNTHYPHVQLFCLIVIQSHISTFHHHQRNTSVNTMLVGSFTVAVCLIIISIQDTHLNFRQQKALLPMSL